MNNCPCSEFRPFVDADIEIVKEYLLRAKYLESNHNIVNMVMWRFYFPLYMCAKRVFVFDWEAS